MIKQDLHRGRKERMEGIQGRGRRNKLFFFFLFQGRLFNELWGQGTHSFIEKNQTLIRGKIRENRKLRLAGRGNSVSVGCWKRRNVPRVAGAQWGLRTRGMGVRGAPWDLKGELQEAGGGPQELMGGGEGGRFWDMGNCVYVCVCVFC